jgi:predicted restriction endonuclease
MSRNTNHGGADWAFSNSVWAPSHTENGKNWPFWTKVSMIRKGDLIIHLRGTRPRAFFTGYSIAADDGGITEERPEFVEDRYSDTKFYRASLTNYIEFPEPINLDYVFKFREEELVKYLKTNNGKKIDKLNLFYVLQNHKLQCLNGAYFSDIDYDLLYILFKDTTIQNKNGEPQPLPSSIQTADRCAMTKTRIGHTQFAQSIKRLYNNKCCFPGCSINDPRFLIASHIARWSDNEELRGELSNGLCLCLLHDKAFELGLFFLDDLFRVRINKNLGMLNGEFIKRLVDQEYKQIRLTKILPSLSALKEHRKRTNVVLPLDNDKISTNISKNDEGI